MSELGAPIEDKPFVMDILSKLPGKYDVIIERINEILDEDAQEEIYDFLMESETDSMEHLLSEFGEDYFTILFPLPAFGKKI